MASVVGIGCGLWLVAFILLSVSLDSMLKCIPEESAPASPAGENSAEIPSTCPCQCAQASKYRDPVVPTPRVTPPPPTLPPKPAGLPLTPFPTRSPPILPQEISLTVPRPTSLPLPSVYPPTPSPASLARLAVPPSDLAETGVVKAAPGFDQTLGDKQATPRQLMPAIGPLPDRSAQRTEAAHAAASAPRRQSGVCLEGDTCAFGLGWCTTADSLPPQKPKGYCKRGDCNGPMLDAYPNTTCASPELALTNVTQPLRRLPKYWLQSIRPQFNKFWGGVLRAMAIHDLELQFDEMYARSIDLVIKEAEGVWLVGCWPPQRYFIIDGFVRVPSGRVVLRSAGRSFVMSGYDLTLRFEKLRAEIACHAGKYVLVSLTGAKGSTAASLTATGEINLRCESAWTVLCLLLGVGGYKYLSTKMVPVFPQLVAYWLTAIDNVELGAGCEPSMHNTVTLLPYSSRRCCEQNFSEDPWGCLVGGQFNGHALGTRGGVRGVSCEPSKLTLGAYTAVCETIPGHYRQLSPGVCREGPLPPSKPRTVNEAWENAHWTLRALGWADMLLTAAVWWVLMVCCCCSCCAGPEPAWRDEREKYMQYSPE